MGQGWFETTHWSVVLKARSSDEAESRDALSTLCQAYWPPVYSYIRHRGHDPENARDLTQEFFTVLLARGGIGEARRERGRFRSFLLKSVTNFLSDEHDRGSALKRGGGQNPISIDAEAWESSLAAQEPSTSMTPEAIFEQRWALAVIERARRELETELTRSGAGEKFRRLGPYLVGEADTPLARLGAELGMSESSVRVTLHRMRQRFARKLREQVAQTVDDPARVEDELRYLIGAVAG